VSVTCLAVLLVSSAKCFADTWQNEYLQNRTGKTATNLEKWFVGDVRVSKWLSQRFEDFDHGYDATNNETKLKWFSGTVADGQWTTACVKTDKNTVTHKYLPRWTFDEGDMIIAGPALSYVFVQQGRSVTLTLSNTAMDAEPIVIESIEVGPVPTLYPIEDLIFERLNDVKWTLRRDNLSLQLDGSQTITLPDLDLPSSAGIVYRAKVHMDGDPENVVHYMGQYQCVPAGPIVPTVGQWGLIIMATLIVGAGSLVIVRRRRVPTV
jgi:hypothetical protein